MRNDDLKTFPSLSRALWVEPVDSERALVESFTAAGLLDLSEERRLEKAASALLERALREGNATNALANVAALNLPFYRLDPRERFLLAALHLGQWSYERAAKVMNASAHEIQEQVWAARMRLGAMQGKYPIGTSNRAGTSCPEYDLKSPWTQRFFDEEMTQQERVYIQNHVMACAGCRETVNRCREIYWAVEAMLPRVEPEQSLLEMLEDILANATELFRVKRGVLETFAIFLSRRDVQIAVGILLAMIALKAMS